MPDPSLNDYVISDLHLGHKRIISAGDPDAWGQRPFNTIEEHDDTIIANINAVCDVGTRLWILGDVAFNRAAARRLLELYPTIYLIGGNHDCKDTNRYFQAVYGCKSVGERHHKTAVLTHIPVHEKQVGEGNRWPYNIHGHTHGVSYGLPFINASCEAVEYRPVKIGELIERATK